MKTNDGGLTEAERKAIDDLKTGEIVTIGPAEPPTPLGLYQLALQRGIPASELGKLLDLHERVESNRARVAFAQAMNDVQSELPRIVRDAENTHTKKKYARLETISAKINPILQAHGFSLSYGTDPTAPPGTLRLYIDVRHREGHTERTYGDFPADKSGSMNAIQGIGSTYSYARRYLKFMAFDLTIADEDDDGQAGSFVTADQIGEIYFLMEECKRVGKPANMPAFLKWLDIVTLEKLPQRDLEKALGELRRKLKLAQQQQEATK